MISRQTPGVVVSLESQHIGYLLLPPASGDVPSDPTRLTGSTFEYLQIDCGLAGIIRKGRRQSKIVIVLVKAFRAGDFLRLLSPKLVILIV